MPTRMVTLYRIERGTRLARMLYKGEIVALTPQDVGRLADLARIELTDEEAARLAPQLDSILAYVANVSEVATDDVPPMSHAMALTNVFREDVATGSFPADAMLANAPDAEEGQFRVPRILDTEAQ